MILKRRNRSGFTLIELMVVIAILSVLILVMYGVVTSMVQATALNEAKITMRDQGRQALQYMQSNLRMAGTIKTDPPTLIQYEDAGGVMQDWPPDPVNPGDEWSAPASNISFVRPRAGDDGFPFNNTVNEINVNWSNVISFQVVNTTTVNGTPNTPINPRLIRRVAGLPDKILVDNISPVVISTPVSPFDTTAVGGVSFQSSTSDPSFIFISIITRRNLGPNLPTLPLRYDGWVSIKN